MDCLYIKKGLVKGAHFLIIFFLLFGTAAAAATVFCATVL